MSRIVPLAGRIGATLAVVLLLTAAGCFEVNTDIRVYFRNETGEAHSGNFTALFHTPEQTFTLAEQDVEIEPGETRPMQTFSRPFECKKAGDLELRLTLANGTSASATTAWPGHGCAEQSYAFVLLPHAVEAWAYFG